MNNWYVRMIIDLESGLHIVTKQPLEDLEHDWSVAKTADLFAMEMEVNCITVIIFSESEDGIYENMGLLLEIFKEYVERNEDLALIKENCVEISLLN